MANLKTNMLHKVITLVLMMALLAPVLTACGGDDTDKTTPAETAASSATPTSVPSITVSDKPVKIGVIVDYSGPSALVGFFVDGIVDFAKWYWNEKQGGILVGNERRPVEFVKVGMHFTQPATKCSM
ncbi:MAG: hypothetical protein PHV74_06020 [Dehalococcoidia bacterium]|nr:hypothetical protein [Dehalococcoidia bacterium]